MTLQGAWKGVVGMLEDHLPNTEWWNVRVKDNTGGELRIALRPDEFVILEE